MVTKRDPVETDLFYHLRELDAERAMDEADEETLEDQEQKSRLADERTPAYTEAWKEKPSNVEYWNWNDDRI